MSEGMADQWLTPDECIDIYAAAGCNPGKQTPEETAQTFRGQGGMFRSQLSMLIQMHKPLSALGRVVETNGNGVLIPHYE